MKRTKNMFYKESHNAENLYLYTVNTSEIYHKHTTPIIQNLRKKAKKGVYDSEKAIDIFYSLANIGAQFYNKEFKEEQVYFSVTDRFTVAVDLENRYREDIFCEV